MSFSHRRAPHWMIVVLLAVLVTRLAGVHLHLCFDGQEPPATVHAGEHADPSEHLFDEQHSDKDVDVLGTMLFKKAGGSIDLPVLLAACIVLLFLLQPARGQWPFAAFYRFFALQPVRLRPPLRGPPLQHTP